MAETEMEKKALSNALLQEAQYIISKKDMNKEDYIKDTMRFYIKEKKRMEIIEELKKGYAEMSRINSELAETGLEQDLKDLDAYESYVGEIV